MGQRCSKNGSASSDPKRDPIKEVSLRDFNILRNIGKGSFCKVCIVQKKDTSGMYALKYMSKITCLERVAFHNVLREVDILSNLNHPYLVNLWFSFQDTEDIFLVSDLLLGGDLRFHLKQRGSFSNEEVRLYTCEISLALDYIHKRYIIHRDIKPDNILLDDNGHTKLTDFNIATVLKDNSLATSLSGTRPYMAPEVFCAAMKESTGYSYPVDWWSLGILVYEMITGFRPYDLTPQHGIDECRDKIHTSPLQVPRNVDPCMIDLIVHLLKPNPERRINSLPAIQQHKALANMDFQSVLRKRYTPSFVPSKEKLNCDPTFELEEMIIEPDPLYKKKKRLSKTNSLAKSSTMSPNEEKTKVEAMLVEMSKSFKVFNREKLLKDEEARLNKLEGELGLRPPMEDNALAKRLGTLQS